MTWGEKKKRVEDNEFLTSQMYQMYQNVLLKEKHRFDQVNKGLGEGKGNKR